MVHYKYLIKLTFNPFLKTYNDCCHHFYSFGKQNLILIWSRKQHNYIVKQIMVNVFEQKFVYLFGVSLGRTYDYFWDREDKKYSFGHYNVIVHAIFLECLTNKNIDFFYFRKNT